MRLTITILFATAATASAQDATPLVDTPSGQELPPGAWPGVSLEDLRGLRECTLEDPPARVNHEVTCRPPILPSRAHVSFGIGWSTGLAVGEAVRGAHRLELDGTYWLTRALGIGGRYALAGTGSATETAARAHQLVGGAELRLFTDEADRDAVTLSVGAGHAYGDAMNDGTFVRAAIARDTGYITREKTAVTWRWELAYAHDLGDAQARTITAGIRAGMELGIRAPNNLREPDRDPPIRSALAGEFRGSPTLGLGASLDFALARPLLWRTTAFWHADVDSEQQLHGLDATWGAVTGPRVIFLPRSIVAPYLDVQAGPAALPERGGARLGALAEAEAGITIHLFCQTRVDLGGRLQTEVTDGVDVRTGFFMLRVAHGTALRRSPADCEASPPFAQR
ncbi:MAG: hypothetical protein SFX73_33820 [Kofleriaceae bacterium]|nr:hypothetical protein [Kofleriaceae bacterium]